MKALLTLSAAALLAIPFNSNAVDYQKEIQPIFQRNCIKCHGNEEEKGRFNLEEGEIEKHIKASGEIRPGNAEKSVLYELLIEEDEEERMPPKKGPLPDEQIALIKQWIDDGAALGNAEEKEKDEADSPEKEGADSEEEKTAGASEMPKPITGSWTNAEGKTIQATLTAVEGDNVVFLMNGNSISYPLAKLSPESQEKARAFAAAMKAAEEK
jgi:mono/diheme cytochrome c family protein